MRGNSWTIRTLHCAEIGEFSAGRHNTLDSVLCQPCQAANECGLVEQRIASTGLSALIFGSDKSVEFAMECRAGVCVPEIVAQNQNLCQSIRSANPVEIDIFEGRSESKFASRKLHMVSYLNQWLQADT